MPRCKIVLTNIVIKRLIRFQNARFFEERNIETTDKLKTIALDKKFYLQL